METLLDDICQALGCEQAEIDQTKHGAQSDHLVDKNKDEQLFTNHMDACASKFPVLSTTHGSEPNADGPAFMCVSFQLPSEILLCVLDNLTVSQLMPCQLVSHQFRAVARMVLMDKLGGRFLRQQQLQYQKQLHQRQAQASSEDGLPPLPRQYRSNSISNNHGGSGSTSQHQLLNSQSQQDHQHHLHHHLYQNQSMEGLSQHPHTDLHIHQQAHSYSVQSHSPSPASESPSSSPPLQYQQQQRQQQLHQTHCRDPGYIAPGTIALFLFPYHDHTPTGWQERQSVHFRCTGMDRTAEQLIFSPIHPDTGDCLKFNTNSWNLPSTLASSMSGRFAGGSMDASSLPSAESAGGYTGPVTGMDLFDYATGQPRSSTRNASNIDGMLGYSFTDQYKAMPRQNSDGSSTSRSTSITSMDSSSRSPSPLSRSSFSSLSPPSSSPVSRFSASLLSRHSSASSWLTANSGGGDHYSVIGIKHGDWPEDNQMASRWWSGDLQSSMTQQSMVFLPWSASPGGQGSVADFHQRLIRQYEQQHQQREPTDSSLRHHPLHTHPTSVPCGTSMCTEDLRDQSQSQGSVRLGVDQDVGGEGTGCTRIHRHHMYMSSRRQRNPPAHHHQYFCLHHDQLMTDIAAINTMKAAAAADIATDFRICELKDNMPMATAGSKHLSIRYGARVSESKRCQFCLASPCKANLEIQVKFNEVRVSLDWILSGFVPDIKKKSPLQARGPGQVPAA